MRKQISKYQQNQAIEGVNQIVYPGSVVYVDGAPKWILPDALSARSVLGALSKIWKCCYINQGQD